MMLSAAANRLPAAADVRARARRRAAACALLALVGCLGVGPVAVARRADVVSQTAQTVRMRVAVLDLDTKQPLEGATVVLLGTGVAVPEPSSEAAAKLPRVKADRYGIAKGRVELKWTRAFGTSEYVSMPPITVIVNRDGYRPFTRQTTEYFGADPLYLRDILLAKEGSGKESRFSDRVLRMTRCAIEPPQGVAGDTHTVTVGVEVPVSFRRELADGKLRLQLYAYSKPTWKGFKQLEVRRTDPGGQGDDLVCSLSFTTDRRMTAGVYPVDVMLWFEMPAPPHQMMMSYMPGEDNPWYAIRHFAVGQTAADAKAQYDRLIGPAGESAAIQWSAPVDASEEPKQTDGQGP